MHGKPEREGFDIWSVRRTAAGWGHPERLGNVINTEESASSASMAANGKLSLHKAPVGTSDLWITCQSFWCNVARGGVLVLHARRWRR